MGGRIGRFGQSKCLMKVRFGDGVERVWRTEDEDYEYDG